ncbi:hypothetical protein JRI60_14415 [Archangium violaceum]|uniref:hypothetical protein n=1 Tax=Archangium violaceum TaxID=83451 RepID=UPI00194DC21E|nr:hypothetical protein [Archangium violaceum]QRO00117.1 hypothetical protein JRI60_14415 [Archangium violaceum]
MSGTSTIPLLPCVSLDETLDFYRALGFEVTYRQTAPNPYAVVCRQDFELHFYGLKGLEPASCHSTCLVVMPEVKPLHTAFAEALRRALGKLPVSGIPRLTRMKPGQGRFTLVDLNGNSVIFVRREKAGASRGEEYPSWKESDSRLAKAVAAAARLRDFKTDDAAAAKVLDVALARNEPAPPVDRARALAARAELAVALGDEARARALRAELQKVPLSPEESQRFQAELGAAEGLERALR